MKRIKKNTIQKLPLILSLVGLMIFFSCQKEESVTKEDSVNNWGSTVSASYAGDDPFDPSETEANSLLSDFHDEVKDENVNSREVSEAIWALEAYLSYFHNNLEYEFDSYDYYEEDFDFALDTTYPGDTMVLGEDILTAYNQINDYVNDELAPDEVYLIDVFFESYSSGIYTLKAGIYAGTKGNLRGSSLKSHFTVGTYEPHYTTLCTSLPLAITNSLNINYNKVCSAPLYTILSNVQKIPKRTIATSCCSGSNLGAELHLYDKHNSNPCLLPGNYTDGGSDNTANGWLNEADWLITWQEAKLSNNDRIILFVLRSGREWHGIYPNGHYDYYHFAKMQSGKVYCAAALE